MKRRFKESLKRKISTKTICWSCRLTIRIIGTSLYSKTKKLLCMIASSSHNNTMRLTKSSKTLSNLLHSSIKETLLFRLRRTTRSKQMVMIVECLCCWECVTSLETNNGVIIKVTLDLKGCKSLWKYSEKPSCFASDSNGGLSIFKSWL